MYKNILFKYALLNPLKKRNQPSPLFGMRAGVSIGKSEKNGCSLKKLRVEFTMTFCTEIGFPVIFHIDRMLEFHERVNG